MHDPLHNQSGPKTAWTTVNAAEAIPGVATPLGWTFYEVPLERAMRAAFADIGVLRRSEVRVSKVADERYSTAFFGRFTANIDEMRRMGDLMPGTSGDAVEQQILGGVRPGVVGHPSKHRYPVVAGQMPKTALSVPRTLLRLRGEIDAWWRASVAATDAAGARDRFAAAMGQFEAAMRPHAVATMLGQALYDQVTKLATGAGLPGLEIRLLTGFGGMEETRLMTDLWAVSRDRRSLAQFQADHGYHGPSEGEVSSRSWREDPSPLEPLLERYRAMDDDAAPSRVETARKAEREAATAELLGALSPPRRVGAKLVLSLARRYIPLREIGKAAFLQSIDVARSAARTLGADLAAGGFLAEPEDVFYLTTDELLARPADGLRDEVGFRRGKRDEYLKLRLPDTWTGMPEGIPLDSAVDTESEELSGLAVSPGVVEGRARVILDPGEVLEQGEILVCETTDPSWTSLFLVAAGLVIDIGGPLSHGAIVARELGVPCVINTRVGTRTLRTGDLVRVDGGAGRVEVLSRA
ncbi:MAG: PEP-utilizing enzyme [Acidimicrobiia bacterium]